LAEHNPGFSPSKRMQGFYDLFGRCHHRGNILSSTFTWTSEGIYKICSKRLVPYWLSTSTVGFAFGPKISSRLPFVVFNALNALLCENNWASSHALSPRSEYEPRPCDWSWAPQRSLNGIGSFKTFIRRIMRRILLNPISSDRNPWNRNSRFGTWNTTSRTPIKVFYNPSMEFNSLRRIQTQEATDIGFTSPNYAPPSGFLNLLTFYSSCALSALFHAESVHGIETFRGFPFPVAATTLRCALPLRSF
jgi:hypothetical protein